MDELDVLKEAIREMNYMLKMKKMNQELYDQLLGSIVYILRYSEQYNVELPNRGSLVSLAFKAEKLIKRINDTSDENLHTSKSDTDLTEPFKDIL